MNKSLELASAIEILNELPDSDDHGELTGVQFLMGQQVTAARPGCAIRINYIYKRIISSDSYEQPDLPFA